MNCDDRISETSAKRPGWLRVLGLLAAAVPACGASFCNPADFQGAYGFQLSGETTISGDAKTVAALGRIVLGPEGAITGTSTVMFAGYLLGNPVTGTYEAHEDCTITWILQDDSGAFQHFSGVGADGGKRIDFKQTDPGGVQKGAMAKIASVCTIQGLSKQYTFTAAGNSTPMLEGEISHTLAAKGGIQTDGNGNFMELNDGGGSQTDVMLTVDDQCSVELNLAVARDGGGASPVHFRGVLVDEGKRILALATDAGIEASATFTAVAPPPVVNTPLPLLP